MSQTSEIAFGIVVSVIILHNSTVAGFKRLTGYNGLLFMKTV